MFRSKAAVLLAELVVVHTQQAIAEALGIQQTTVSGYVRGRCRPTLPRALVLQEKYGVPVEAWGVEADEAPLPTARRARGAITAKQQQLVDFIRRYSAEHGEPPTMREMSAAIGTKTPNSVAGHLLRMQCAGLVTWVPGIPRTVKVLEPAPSAGAE